MCHSTFGDGAFVAIVGPSGSGKTTLLGLLAGLDTPSAGSATSTARRSTHERRRARAASRRESRVRVPDFQLIPTLTAVENVAVPLELRGSAGAGETGERAARPRLGLADRARPLPYAALGRRTAARGHRAGVRQSAQVLFADEPTGNLDGATGAHIVALLEELNRD